MKHRTGQYLTIFQLLCWIILDGCGSIGALTGGPKDEIPPRLIYSSPKDQTTDFQAQHLEFHFDEPIKIQNLKKNLTITPNENRDFRFKAFKNILTLDFETPLSEATTYILDFGDAVSDMTETNKLSNFKVAFSTGKYIDSLFVSGKVREAKTNQPAKNCRVGLYDVSDTLDIDTGKPKYVAVTDTAGVFLITNVRPSNYKLYALQEPEKQDFIYNSSAEKIAFEPQEIRLVDVGRVDYDLRLSQYDLDTFAIKSAREKRHYFEVTTNKTIAEFEVEFQDKTYDSVVFYQKEGSILRFFNKNLNETDSIRAFIALTDSSQNTIRDTIFVQFNEKRSKQAHPFRLEVKPQSGTTFQQTDSLQLQFTFSAPVAYFVSDSLTFRFGKDTIDNQIDNSKFKWNKTRTQLKIDHWFRMDSAQIQFEIRDKMFASFEGDSTTKQPLQYTRLQAENFGELTGEVRSEFPRYIFELMDEQGNVEKIVDSPKVFAFDFVKTGKKQVRILIDANENGVWDKGDFHQRIPPEEVRIFDIKQEIKAGWTVEDIFIELQKND